MSRRNNRGLKNYILYSPYSPYPFHPRRRRSGITESDVDQTSGPTEVEPMSPQVLISIPFGISAFCS